MNSVDAKILAEKLENLEFKGKQLKTDVNRQGCGNENWVVTTWHEYE